MLREKGSLAGATLNGKIYAIGGGDGVKCFSDVEMFDPAQGGWINIQSMLQTRFTPAAAELNGAIYALSGYDGNAYLRTVTMGAGRKTQTISVHENVPCSTVPNNGCFSARKLRVGDLSRVMFGCTHDTMAEWSFKAAIWFIAAICLCLYVLETHNCTLSMFFC